MNRNQQFYLVCIALGVIAALAFSLFSRPAPPVPRWEPECPEARVELRMARSVTWDYDKFRYHLDRAILLEAQHQASKASQ